jgi:hypothetical protein
VVFASCDDHDYTKPRMGARLPGRSHRRLMARALQRSVFWTLSGETSPGREWLPPTDVSASSSLERNIGLMPI